MGLLARRARLLGGLAAIAIIIGGVGLAAAWSRLFPGPLARGQQAYERQDWAGAAALAKAALKEQPGRTEGLKLLARASARLGRDDAAQGLYNRLGTQRMEPEDYFLVGSLMVRRGRLDLAEKVLQLSRKGEHDRPEAIYALAELCLQRDRLADATQLAARLGKFQGWEAVRALTLGKVHMALDDPASAGAAFEEALGRDPWLKGSETSPAEASNLLVRALLRQHRPREALARLLNVVGSRGENTERAWLLSRALLQAGDAAGAARQSQQFRRKHVIEPEPASYVGARRCESCHAEIYRAQRGSRHAKTFFQANELGELPLPDRPLPDPAEPKVSHVLARAGDRVTVETHVGKDVYRALVNYALGSGDRGLTLVGHDESNTPRELRLSLYDKRSHWDRTSGQAIQPAVRAGFLGEPLSADELRRCIDCHTTSQRMGREHDVPLAADRGIGCERCHGPGENHLLAVAAGLDDPAIAQPRLASAEEITGLCARCHSPRNQVVHPSDPTAVRFQGTTLTWSRCYSESGGGLSCLTCHDPHRNVESSATHYELRCLACHSAKPPPKMPRHTALADGKPRVVCPVNATTDCIKCHMPVMSGVALHSSFTDHFIRVHREKAGSTQSNTE
jgi:tetratricopeptide (TPR) repeat protein